jgi:hypothetical protein
MARIAAISGNNEKPIVKIIAPVDDAVLTGILNFKTAASTPITSVAYYIGAFQLGEAGKQGDMWILEDIDTTQFSNGSYTIEARGDWSGGTVSDFAPVTVSNTSTGPVDPATGVTMTSPANGATVVGSVSFSATVDASLGATSVVFETGRPERTPYAAAKSGTTTTWNGTRVWKSSLDNAEVNAVVNDYRCAIRAKATTPSGVVYSPYIYVITNNKPIVGAPTPAWNAAHAWSADYSTWTTYKNSFSSAIGEDHTTIVTDPRGVHGNVAFAQMPNTPTNLAEQPTTSSVRWQFSTRTELQSGSLTYFGFAFMPATNFPTMYKANDPADPDYPDPNGTGHIAIMQNYGGPYVRGPGFALDARYEHADDTYNEFRMIGNAMNPGDPGKLFGIPYHKNLWTDFVFGVALSPDINKGWMEAYVREPADGAGSPLRQLTLNGMLRVPRVLFQIDGVGNRWDNQIYRRKDEYSMVSCYFAKQKIGSTPASVDPHSY